MRHGTWKVIVGSGLPSGPMAPLPVCSSSTQAASLPTGRKATTFISIFVSLRIVARSPAMTFSISAGPLPTMPTGFTSEPSSTQNADMAFASPLLKRAMNSAMRALTASSSLLAAAAVREKPALLATASTRAIPNIRFTVCFMDVSPLFSLRAPEAIRSCDRIDFRRQSASGEVFHAAVQRHEDEIASRTGGGVVLGSRRRLDDAARAVDHAMIAKEAVEHEAGLDGARGRAGFEVEIPHAGERGVVPGRELVDLAQQGRDGLGAEIGDPSERPREQTEPGRSREVIEQTPAQRRRRRHDVDRGLDPRGEERGFIPGLHDSRSLGREMARRRVWSARARRDLTVPTGKPRCWAHSVAERPSK